MARIRAMGRRARDQKRCAGGTGRVVDAGRRGWAGHQQLIQLGAPSAVRQVRHPRPGFPAGPGRRGRHPLQHVHHAGPDHPRRGQPLTCQPERQFRRVVFHRRGDQNSSSSFHPRAVHCPPAQVAGDFRGWPVRVCSRDRKPAAHRPGSPASRQTWQRSRRSRGDLGRDKPQPRQRAQLNRRTQHQLRPP